MSTILCPKCGQAMRAYTRPATGEQMLQCNDRKGCNLGLPVASAPAPDHGLADVKALPDSPADGLSGLKFSTSLENDHLASAHQIAAPINNFLPGIETVHRNNSRRISRFHETESGYFASNPLTNKVSTSEQRSSNEIKGSEEYETPTR